MQIDGIEKRAVQVEDRGFGQFRILRGGTARFSRTSPHRRATRPDHVLQKPFKVHELQIALRELLEQGTGQLPRRERLMRVTMPSQSRSSLAG